MNLSTTLLAILFVFLWNSGFIGAEYGLPYAGPFTQLFWRYSALTLILFLYLILRGRFQWPGWSTAFPNFLVGILAHGVWLSCSLLSLQYNVPAGIVALIVALQPLTTGALSGYFVGEYTSLYRWLGLSIGFLGVSITVISRIDFTDLDAIFGYFIPFGSVIAMTAASLIQRRLEVHKHPNRLSLDLALFYQSLPTTIVLFIPAVFLEEVTTHWKPDFVGAMLWLIFAVSLGAYALMFQLLARIDATRVASLFFLGPPVTMVMAWVVFGDTLLLTDLAGLIIVTVGVMLTYLQFEGLNS
jgi:drug/metabolite transporter (DMT)-like permease